MATQAMIIGTCTSNVLTKLGYGVRLECGKKSLQGRGNLECLLLRLASSSK